MVELLRDFYTAIQQRLRSPIFGFIAVALILANWDKIFYLASAETTAAVRIRYVKIDYNPTWDFLIPTTIAAALCVAHPWVILVFSKLSVLPTEKLKAAQFKSMNNVNHAKLTADIEYEIIRAKAEELRETHLIERAKREKVLRDAGGEDLVNEAAKLRAEAAEPDPDRIDLSKVETAVIKVIGAANSPISGDTIIRTDYIVNIIQKSNPRAGGSRVPVMALDAINSLERKGLIQDQRNGYLLTKKGFDVFDKV